MNNAAFLLIAVAVSVVASMFLWLRTRKPTTFMSSIDSFQREMAALARDPEAEMTPPRRPTVLRPIVPSQNGGLADKFRAARQSAGEELADRRGARRMRQSSAGARGAGRAGERATVEVDRGIGRGGWDDGS